MFIPHRMRSSAIITLMSTIKNTFPFHWADQKMYYQITINILVPMTCRRLSNQKERIKKASIFSIKFVKISPSIGAFMPHKRPPALVKIQLFALRFVGIVPAASLRCIFNGPYMRGGKQFSRTLIPKNSAPTAYCNTGSFVRFHRDAAPPRAFPELRAPRLIPLPSTRPSRLFFPPARFLRSRRGSISCAGLNLRSRLGENFLGGIPADRAPASPREASLCAQLAHPCIL